jgi:hypothetical protein
MGDDSAIFKFGFVGGLGFLYERLLLEEKLPRSG